MLGLRFVQLTFVAVIACSCGGGRFRTPDIRPGTAHSEKGGEFWVIADSQLNSVSGDREQSEFHDAIENVAIRPVSLDLWSSLILRHVVQQISAADDQHAPVFFLGDAANTSCQEEYERFLWVMDDENRTSPWFAAIGNHDGYYMGNLGGPAVGAEWERACSVPGGLASAPRKELEPWLALWGRAVPAHTMPKALSVLLYLDSMGRRVQLKPAPLDLQSWKESSESGEPRLVFEGTGQFPDASGRLLEVKVRASIGHGNDPWRNVYAAWVVQSVEMPNHDRVLIADTSDFLRPPPQTYEWAGIKGKVTGVRDLPGQLGMVSRSQAQALERYASELPTGRQFWILGHHDWQSISIPGAYHLRRKLFQAKGFVSYASAHTHNPTATGGVNGDRQWEVNVASLTDWPMEYAKVSYWPTSDGNGADVAVKRLQAYESGAEASCHLSRPHQGSAAGDVQDRFDELSDAGDRYVRRGLALYARVLESVKTDAQYSDIFQTVTAAVIDDYQNDIASALAEAKALDHGITGFAYEARFRLSLSTMKNLLHKLHVLDERHLQRSQALAHEERSCAIWASHSEQEYWAGSVVGKLIRAKERPKKLKSVIDGGLRMQSEQTLFQVLSGDLPKCPDREQRRNWLSRLLFSGC